MSTEKDPIVEARIQDAIRSERQRCVKIALAEARWWREGGACHAMAKAIASKIELSGQDPEGWPID
jgi:hypothetical protein